LDGDLAPGLGAVGPLEPHGALLAPPAPALGPRDGAGADVRDLEVHQLLSRVLEHLARGLVDVGERAVGEHPVDRLAPLVDGVRRMSSMTARRSVTSRTNFTRSRRPPTSRSVAETSTGTSTPSFRRKELSANPSRSVCFHKAGQASRLIPVSTSHTRSASSSL